MLPPPRPIRPLADHLINQIAAGEVVERPASIVKELIENSLDAGAGAIRIEVRGGGIESIAVDDDGQGISRDQLGLALARHCTSKIAVADDLQRIVSLGFRGEALASIAAVAEVSLTSRTADAPHAYTLQVQPGRAVPPPAPASRLRGTTIVVRDLFATVPARRQFLRRAATELLAIQQLVRGIAFCAPGVAVTLSHDDQRQWHAPAAKDERSNALRWRAVFGAPFAREARFVELVAGAIRVHGWIGPPSLARGQSDLQFLAVNGRLIRDRQLLHGIRTAFGDALASGRYACFALHLELDPTRVDVNVHPHKTEVRFKDLREVHDVLYAATRQALAGVATPPAHAILSYPAATGARTPQVAESRAREFPRVAAHAEPRAAEDPETALIAGRYLPLVTADGDLELIDLCGAIRELFDATRAPVASRALAFPVRVPAPPGPAHGLDLMAFAAFGFDFAAIGPHRWVLRAVPAALPELNGEVFVDALLREPAFAATPALAAAGACARALSVPAAMAERRAWLARWWRDCVRPGRDGARHRRVVDAAALARLFAHDD